MKREPSICEQRPGFCCGDARCPDHLCPGHPRMEGVPFYQADGGHTFNRGLVFPIAREEDLPLYAPDTAAEPMPVAMQAVFCLVITVALAIASGALDPLIPYLKP